MRNIKENYEKIEKLDRAARKLQGFFLKIMYKRSLTKRQWSRPLVPDYVFNLRIHSSLRDQKLAKTLAFVR